jgi:flagellar biosynthesis/type III secretory pathway protein FliH
MAIGDLEWFEIHLRHIDNEKDFEEAMEMAHVKGYENGYESGEEEGYNSGIYSSVVDEKIESAIKKEQERIITLLESAGYSAVVELISQDTSPMK